MMKGSEAGCVIIFATEVLVVVSVSGITAAKKQRVSTTYQVRRRRGAGGIVAVSAGRI
jgi:hypothetical protein